MRISWPCREGALRSISRIIQSRNSSVWRTLEVQNAANCSLAVSEKIRKRTTSALALNIIERASTLTEGCHKTRLLRMRVSFVCKSGLLDGAMLLGAELTAQGGTSSRLLTTVVVAYAAVMTDS